MRSLSILVLATPIITWEYCTAGVISSASRRQLFVRHCAAIRGYIQGYTNLALLLLRQLRFREAEQEARNAIRSAPGKAEPYTMLGIIQDRLSRHEEAIQSLQTAIRLQPDSTEAHFNLGIVKANQSDFKGALQEFAEVVHRNPLFAAGRYEKGRMLLELNDPESAAAELGTACRLDPNLAPALALLARIESQAHHPVKAIELLERVTALKPRDPDLHYKLGRELLETGNTAAAISHLETAARLSPEAAQPVYKLCTLMKELDPGKAQVYCRQLAEIKRKQQAATLAEVPKVAAEHAASRRDWDAAIRNYHESIATCADCGLRAELHKALGFAYCYSDDARHCGEELRIALNLKPDDVETRWALDGLESSQRPEGPGVDREHESGLGAGVSHGGQPRFQPGQNTRDFPYTRHEVKVHR